MAISPTDFVPSVTTPLLGNGPQRRHVQRVPTFFTTSIPNRRSILRAFTSIAVHMLFELVLPIALYYVLRLFVSPLLSLLIAGLPPALIVIVKGFRERKTDMTGVLMLLGFAVSAVLAVVQSDPKLYLLRESAMTLAMGLMLLATLIPFRWRHHVLRPFMFYVARQIALSSTIILHPSTVREHWSWFWDYWSSFRLFFRTLTGIWGLGLVSEFVVRVALIEWVDDVDDVIYYSNLYMFVVLGLLAVLTLASTLSLRHLYNLKQGRAKVNERRSEIESIIARAAAEQSHVS
ncbi:uncharacterized protein BYT42DRAFT_587413 [Radiomyces spectabilis]|uniref:uncharacterized protein n=1 Tax=Radiomyces spectabilis TaxID=64574 RepID=UPI00221F97CE|nr:uncharacterized protein BYT42DRAFT_587413 [Radiomyces spectabilis]KAI8366661.1 hypothetical protein BYT42DRAFT_587413 [Radiomyces spectabilis]